MLKTAFILDSCDSETAIRRVIAHMELFEKEGIDIFPVTFPHRRRQRRRFFRDMQAFDVVIIEDILMSRRDLAALRRYVGRIGYDLTLSPLDGLGTFQRFRARTRLGRTLRMADFLTAADESLLSLLEGAGSEPSVIPTPTAVAAVSDAPGSDSIVFVRKWAEILKTICQICR